jgi:ABC-type nickel/cobalt efflux system permease component RcnA
LSSAAAGIAFAHTLLGVDHYLPFVVMAKARGWSMVKTIKVTALCGVGHIIGSIMLGSVGILVGIQLSSLMWVEGVRGDLAAWALVTVGLLYICWGLRRAHKIKSHSDWHSNNEKQHSHSHSYHAEHSHIHRADIFDERSLSGGRSNMAPWAVFVIFVLGPCEPLIPLLMYPAAQQSLISVAAVSAVFFFVTLATMLLAVTLSTYGLQFIQLSMLRKFDYAFVGSALVMCGLSIIVLGV